MLSALRHHISPTLSIGRLCPQCIGNPLETTQASSRSNQAPCMVSIEHPEPLIIQMNSVPPRYPFKIQSDFDLSRDKITAKRASFSSPNTVTLSWPEGGIAEGGSRTLTLLPGRDFESRASANSATSAIPICSRAFAACYRGNNIASQQ